jgi:HEAT repeat protein
MTATYPIEFLIIMGFAAVATLLVLVISVSLVIHKAIEFQRSWRQERLYGQYSSVFAEILLQDLPVLPPEAKPGAILHQYESLIQPVKKRLAAMTLGQRKVHEEVLRRVMIDFAQDLSGEPSERLVYFFYVLGFVEEQLRLMKSRHWWIRAHAAREIGQVRARKGIASLTAALEDHHQDVRNQAIQSLIVLVGVDALDTIFGISRNLSKWTEIELSVIIMNFREEAVPSLINALDSRDDSIASFAIEMLAEIGFTQAVDALLHILQEHRNPAVRAKAAEALGRLGDERAEHALLMFVANPHAGLRLRSIEALGSIGTPGALPLLQGRLTLSAGEEQTTIARAIGRCGAQGRLFLEQCIHSGDSLISAVAAQVLEELGADPAKA